MPIILLDLAVQVLEQFILAKLLAVSEFTNLAVLEEHFGSYQAA